MKEIEQKVFESLRNLCRYIESENYAGYDPYDALNSPLINLFHFNNKWTKIAFTQLLKKLPINLRPFLGIQKGFNPKAIGLFLMGYSKLSTIDNFAENKNNKKIDFFMELLTQLICKGYSGNCWGFNFDWQSRIFFRPRGTPTIVNTSFIGHALLDCYKLTGNKKALYMALSIKDFILNDLRRTYFKDTFCFSYTPVDSAVIHNANMLGASLLIRLNKYLPKENLEKYAMQSLKYSMIHQREDGSWYYADTPTQRWIDSFHTGFNLQALRCFLKRGYAEEYKNAFEKGVRFYKNNFFLTNGTPKYYHNKKYPIDIHSPAQAIYFFSGMGEEYKDLTYTLIQWLLGNMRNKDGSFYYQKKKFYINKISYMRWSQAWVFHGLVEFLYNLNNKTETKHLTEFLKEYIKGF